jgi:hypothetical protein
MAAKLQKAAYRYFWNCWLIIIRHRLWLKGQLHVIFDPQFFHQSTPLIHVVKPFRIWICIRRDNRFESRQNGFNGTNDHAETENEV